MRSPVIFDGRNIYNPEQHAGAGLHLLLDGPAVSASSSRAAPATSAATPSRRCGRAARPSSSTTTSQPATARPRRTRRAAGRRRHPRHGAAARGDRDAPASDAVMHFAAWLSVGDSVRDPAGYYHNNVTGALSVLDAMVADRRARTSSSRRPAPIFGEPDRDADSRGPAQARRSTPTARPSSRSSARCRTTSGPTACGRSRCATSTPPAPIRTASWARITPRRST